MARNFDGNDEVIRDVGALSGMTFGTFAWIIKRGAVGAVAHSLTTLATGATERLQIYFDGSPADTISWWTGTGSGSQAGNQASSTSVWYLIVFRKATGNVAARSSILDMSTGTWTHTSGGNMGNNTAPGVGGTVRHSFDGASEFFNGDMAVEAAWSNVVKWSSDATGDAQIEAAGLQYSLQAWYNAGPHALWVYDQAATGTAVMDLMGGGANQTTLTGSQVSTTSVPLFSYGHDVLVPQSVPAVGGGDALAQPAVIAVTSSLPQTQVSVAAAPAVTARSFTTPQASVGVAAAPAVIARAFTLPDAPVGVGAAPAVLAAVVAMPGWTVSTGAGPDTVPAVIALPQATPDVGGGGATATPAVVARAFTLPQAVASIGAAPLVIARSFTTPQAAVGIVAAPAVAALVASLPQVAVSVGVAPLVIARAFVLPQATPDTGGTSATATPAVIVTTVALPQALVGVGAAPLVIARSFTLPQAVAGGSITASPAVTAMAFALPQAAAGVGASPATIAVLVAFPAPFLPGQLRVLIAVDTYTTAGVVEAGTNTAGQPS